MSWFEKIGLVEKHGEETVNPVSQELEQEETVDVEINSSKNVVDEIFAQNGIVNNGNSIYMIDSLMSNLPEEMTTAKKISTVRGNLTVFGKNISDLISDGNKRIEILNKSKEDILNDKNALIEGAKSDIENLKQAIENATVAIHEAEDIISSTNSSVVNEVKRIETLIGYCNEMEKEEK